MAAKECGDSFVLNKQILQSTAQPWNMQFLRENVIYSLYSVLYLKLPNNCRSMSKIHRFNISFEVLYFPRLCSWNVQSYIVRHGSRDAQGRSYTTVANWKRPSAAKQRRPVPRSARRLVFDAQPCPEFPVLQWSSKTTNRPCPMGTEEPARISHKGGFVAVPSKGISHLYRAKGCVHIVRPVATIRS